MTQDQINADLFDQCKKLQAEVATLRAKSAAYDKGTERWAVFDGESSIITTGPTKALATQGASMLMFGHPDGWDLLMRRGGTCSKVRVCGVVA